MVACDLDGNVIWRNSRKSMAGASMLAGDGGLVYIQSQPGVLYRLSAGEGNYVNWPGTESPDLLVARAGAGVPAARIDGLDAANGRLYLSFTGRNKIAILDGKNGKAIRVIKVANPGDLEVGPKGLLYAIAGGKSVMLVDADGGASTELITGLVDACGLAVDSAGLIYVGVRGKDSSRVTAVGTQ